MQKYLASLTWKGRVHHVLFQRFKAMFLLHGHVSNEGTANRMLSGLKMFFLVVMGNAQVSVTNWRPKPKIMTVISRSIFRCPFSSFDMSVPSARAHSHCFEMSADDAPVWRRDVSKPTATIALRSSSNWVHAMGHACQLDCPVRCL